MWVIHLPGGPTAKFKITSTRLSKEIKNHGATTSHKPELILNNFNTRLGHSVPFPSLLALRMCVCVSMFACVCVSLSVFACAEVPSVCRCC